MTPDVADEMLDVAGTPVALRRAGRLPYMYTPEPLASSLARPNAECL